MPSVREHSGAVRVLMAHVVGSLVCTLLLPACGPRLSDDECFRLLEHYTDKVVDQSRPTASPGQRARLIREAKDKAQLDPEFLACPERVSRSQYECALAASSADQVERCLL